MFIVYTINIIRKHFPKFTKAGGWKGMDEMATRLELLATLYSLEALLETDNAEKALEVIKKVITEAETKQ